MSVISVNKTNFEQIKNSEKTVLLDFYADWCGPCRMLAPIIEQIAEENPEFTVGKINVDEEPELANAFGVTSIPSLFVLEKGEIIAQSMGAKPKEQILKILERGNGYFYVDLYDENGKPHHKNIHNLVADAFLDNPLNLPCVNHKDENKQNNCVDNLQWATPAENNNYGTRRCRMIATQTNRKDCSKPACPPQAVCNA